MYPTNYTAIELILSAQKLTKRLASKKNVFMPNLYTKDS